MTDSKLEAAREKRQENLDKLHGLREELQIIAASDADYAKYARNFLRTLHRAGYDVEIPEGGSRTHTGEATEGGQFCPSCGEAVDAGEAFCRHSGSDLPEGRASCRATRRRRRSPQV
jgi:predicted nucleic acid-binding Zn ribbon protein